MSKKASRGNQGRVKLGRNYARRSGGGPHRDKRREWETLKRTHYSGYYRCAGCGEITFCAGRTREKVRCETCFGVKNDDPGEQS